MMFEESNERLIVKSFLLILFAFFIFLKSNDMARFNFLFGTLWTMGGVVSFTSGTMFAYDSIYDCWNELIVEELK